ncbi:MAG: hypothetical protein A3H98_02815 [Bacteroidetes bacterium RIFCSPLOWO2_02_FULL_36_8]|nr:MAG: hypothetical protein A3H98_02815 [Bacteroidetes bacterium RIFCSPLOWO2_02_FULL_36_8]OFY72211.1 MAG: hypothetical protein A3G23_01430 [Bacteroidetes bacterium RIFCSPLOWO2_12_FULL_37_12]
MDIERKLEVLEKKIQKLIALYKDYKEQVDTLKSENNSLKAEIENKITELRNHQNKEKISKIAMSIGADVQKSTELKLMINEHIREIDKCIAYLNQ